MCEALWQPDMNTEEIFECIAQALTNALDRDASSGWGAVVHIIEPERITTKKIKTRMDWNFLLTYFKINTWPYLGLLLVKYSRRIIGDKSLRKGFISMALCWLMQILRTFEFGPASWSEFKNVQNLHKSTWHHRKETLYCMLYWFNYLNMDWGNLSKKVLHLHWFKKIPILSLHRGNFSKIQGFSDFKTDSSSW